MSLYAEIVSQPDILRRALEANSAPVQEICRALEDVRSVFIAARGSSDNAARYAKYTLGIFNRLPAALAAPSIFTKYGAPPVLVGALAMGISQSGQSPDIVAVIEAARRQGQPTLAITNQVDSPLARAAAHVIDIGAGPENAVAATKTYTAQLLAIALFSAHWARDQARLAALAQLPEWMETGLDMEPLISEAAVRYRYMQHCVVLGRGFNYATAFEWALKLKEMTYIMADPYSSADFLHGPLALVGRRFPVFAVAPDGAVFDGMLNLLRHLKEDLSAELMVISDRPAALDLADFPVALPAGIPEWLSPIVSMLPVQLFVYHLTRIKGLDTEAPRQIRKITRTE